MKSGRLRHLVEIQRPERTVDEYGQTVENWVKFAERRAAILPVSMAEQEAFAKLQAELTHSVVIRFCDGIAPDMRIYWPATKRAFNIVEIKQDATFRRDMILKVTELVEAYHE